MSADTPTRDRTLLEAVASELGTRCPFWDVTIEYPGYVLMTGGPGGGAWSIGTANQDWGGNFCPEEDAEITRSFEVPGSRDWTSPAIIAGAILEAMEEASA